MYIPAKAPAILRVFSDCSTSLGNRLEPIFRKTEDALFTHAPGIADSAYTLGDRLLADFKAPAPESNDPVIQAWLDSMRGGKTHLFVDSVRPMVERRERAVFMGTTATSLMGSVSYLLANDLVQNLLQQTTGGFPSLSDAFHQFMAAGPSLGTLVGAMTIACGALPFSLFASRWVNEWDARLTSGLAFQNLIGRVLQGDGDNMFSKPRWEIAFNSLIRVQQWPKAHLEGLKRVVLNETDDKKVENALHLLGAIAEGSGMTAMGELLSGKFPGETEKTGLNSARRRLVQRHFLAALDKHPLKEWGRFLKIYSGLESREFSYSQGQFQNFLSDTPNAHEELLAKVCLKSIHESALVASQRADNSCDLDFIETAINKVKSSCPSQIESVVKTLRAAANDKYHHFYNQLLLEAANKLEGKALEIGRGRVLDLVQGGAR